MYKKTAKKGFCIVRVSHIIVEGSEGGEEDQVPDTVKGAVQGMHQVVQDPRKMKEGKRSGNVSVRKSNPPDKSGNISRCVVIQLCTG